MEVRQAIANRHATRHFRDVPVSDEDIRQLLEEAVLAPSAVNRQPWTFLVIQDKELLKFVSDRSKHLMARSDVGLHMSPDFYNQITSNEFNIFYNAGTLILVCAKPEGEHPDWDCCFAAENLMLAATEMGLATCPIGFAWGALAQPDVKEKLGIPGEYLVVLPIIVGYPLESPKLVDCHAPEILAWHRPKVLIAN